MVTSRQPTVSSTRRDAWVEVDLGAIEHNVKVALSWLQQPAAAGETTTAAAAGEETRSPAADVDGATPRLMAVVKSDAYGHGALGVAEVLIGSGAQWLAVASIDEGCQLRSASSTVPILILSPVPQWAIQTGLDHNLDFTVTNESHLHDIEAIAKRRHGRARVHLKVDTGMHRLGVPPEKVDLILGKVMESKHLQLISVFSHLAKADESEATNYQNEQFALVVKLVQERQPKLIAAGAVNACEPLIFHLDSGDAARRFPSTHYDMVRVGLLLYGLEPDTVSRDVVPAMSVRARVNQINEIAAGESVGYGWTWTAKRPTRLACVPIGYADGVDRRLSNRLTGLMMGQLINQVGRISMDQMLFDVTDVPGASEGDVITLIGTEGDQQLHLASWAVMLDTITYELACRMRVRLPRIYTRHRTPANPANQGQS